MLTSYSQGGEDLAARLLLVALGRDTGKIRYLDIGAGRPWADSNTAYFYRYGARGVLVEPNPAFCALLRNDRPGDLVVEAGVAAAANPVAVYHTGPDPHRNSFVGPQPLTEGRLAVPLVSIDSLLYDHFRHQAPDFVSVDAEGLTREIAEAWPFDRCRPAVMCLELDHGDSRRWDQAIIARMLVSGYLLRGASLYNGTFVDEALLR